MLEKELDKADDEVLDLKLERDMYKEEHEKVRQKYIDKDVELQIVDRIVLQYEQRINILEEEIEELKNYMEESKEYEKNDCMELLYVNRDEPRQYKCITINHKESVETQYIYAYTIKEAIEMLHKMQNVTRIIDIWEVK